LKLCTGILKSTLFSFDSYLAHNLLYHSIILLLHINMFSVRKTMKYLATPDDDQITIDQLPLAFRKHNIFSPSSPRSSMYVPSDTTRRVSWTTSSPRTYSRPRTLRKDIPSLYYSKSDMIRFRREAEAVELLEKLSVEVKQSEDTDKLKLKPFTISKAIVVTDNSTKTYESGVVTYANLWSVDLDALKHEAERKVSFDNDEFWTGQITYE